MKRPHLIAHLVGVGVLLVALLAGWLVGWVDFFEPWWLLALLALPVFPYFAMRGISGLPSRTSAFAATVRAWLFVGVVACLADVQYVRTTDSLCVLYLLDHSSSIPDHIIAKELEYVNTSSANRGRRDEVGIVVFGQDASVEVTPRLGFKVDRVYSAVNKDYTNLQSAVELAVAAFPTNSRKKVVIISDGNENAGDLLAGVRYAVGNSVEVDVLPVYYDFPAEVLVESLQLPEKIKENEPFDLKVHVDAQQDGPAELTIYRNGSPVATEKVQLKAGSNTFSATMKIEETGFQTYSARISSEHDSIQANNEASNYVYIQGESRILFVAPNELEVQYLIEACQSENLESEYRSPSNLPQSLEEMQNYDCVVLANVGASELSETQKEMLRANVRDLGVGLIMVGGVDSFGAGGWGDTPVEEALPVTMDIKQKKINPKGALVLILHTCEFADGNYWAKEITKESIKTVNPQDEVGVVYFDYNGQDKWLFSLRAAENKPALYNLIDKCEPADMPSFAPAFTMAVNDLTQSDAMVKHIIVISDGDPGAPRPADVKAMAAAGISVSTIAINPHSPRDVDLLKYLAQQTDGRYYFVTDPKNLPRIFSKEAKVVKRSLIFNEPFHPMLVNSSELTKGVKAEEIPALLAYVATTPRERAVVPLVSDNENHDPILAHWQYGLGRSVAFTSDATSNWGKNWVGWDKYKKVWGQTLRWASRKREKTNMSIHTQTDGTRTKLVIDAINDDGSFINFLKLKSRLVDPNNEGSSVDIRQTAPARYEAEFDTSKPGVNILNIGYTDPATGKQGFEAIGIAVPYSPEYKQLKTNIVLLRQAALIGGGKVLGPDTPMDAVFKTNLPPYRASQPLLEWLAILLILALFFDIVMRRVVFTRSDMAAAAHAVRSRLPSLSRRRVREQDATMSTLLARKQQVVAGHKGGPAAPGTTPDSPAADAPGTSPLIKPTGDFRERLAKKARTTDAAPPVATASSDSPGAKPASPASPSSTDKPAAPKEEGGGYTNRLLEAKRRARERKDGDTEKPPE